MRNSSVYICNIFHSLWRGSFSFHGSRLCAATTGREEPSHMDQIGESKREEPLWMLFQREFPPPSGQLWASRKRSFQQHRQSPLPTPRQRKHRVCSVLDFKPVKVRPHSNNETLVFSLPSKHSLFLSPRLESWKPSLALPSSSFASNRLPNPAVSTSYTHLKSIPSSSPQLPLSWLWRSSAAAWRHPPTLFPVACPMCFSVNPSDTQEIRTYSTINHEIPLLTALPWLPPLRASPGFPTVLTELSALSPNPKPSLPRSPHSLLQGLNFAAPSAIPLLLSLACLPHLRSHPTPIFISFCFISSLLLFSR